MQISSTLEEIICITGNVGNTTTVVKRKKTSMPSTPSVKLVYNATDAFAISAAMRTTGSFTTDDGAHRGHGWVQFAANITVRSYITLVLCGNFDNSAQRNC